MVLEVDENNPSELKRAISLLQKRRKSVLRDLGYVGISFQGSRVNIGSVLPLLEAMLDMDFEHLYGNSSLDRSYYVYMHCDPTKCLNVQGNIKHLLLASRFRLTHEPFYVGKGTGERAAMLARNEGHRKIRGRLLKLGQDVLVCKIADGLTEAGALSLEAKLIDVLGLRMLGRDGILVNLDEGHDSSGRRLSYSKVQKDILRKNGFGC